MIEPHGLPCAFEGRPYNERNKSTDQVAIRRQEKERERE